MERIMLYKPNSYYSTPGVRKTCHVLKNGAGTAGYQDAVNAVALYFQGLGIIKAGDYLVPAPQHTGHAEYMLDIASRLSCLTGAKVLDVVSRIPADSRYDLKQKGQSEEPVFFLKNRCIPSNGRLFFLDNVIATGTTYRKVNMLFQRKLIPLVYATDDQKNILVQSAIYNKAMSFY